MRSKKNVLVSLSVFIAVIFVLTLFGQQPQKGYLWDTISAIGSTVKDNVLRIAELEENVADLRATQSELFHQLNTHTHDLPSHIHDISDIDGVIDADTLQGSDASVFAPSAHTHNYSEISNPPSIPTEAEIIGLINKHALGHPDWDSGWRALEPGTSLRIYHNLGGNPDNYLVDLQFYFAAPAYLVHNIHIGGSAFAEHVGQGGHIYRTLGASWSGLDNESIKMHLREDEGAITHLRVRIWKYED
jgi:hypothetical protein